jgi:hypothetical protein
VFVNWELQPGSCDLEDRNPILQHFASFLGRATPGSAQITPAHTIRTGFFFSAEQAFVGNTSLVEPVVGGAPVDAPFNRAGWA